MPCRQENSTIKKTKINASALQLFAEKSYHKVLMDDIAKNAGIAKGTLYIYYKSKEELYQNVLNEYLCSLVELVKLSDGKINNTISKLYNFVTTVFSYLHQNKNFYLIYQKESLCEGNENYGLVIQTTAELTSILGSIIKQGIKDGLFINADAKELLTIIFSSVSNSSFNGTDCLESYKVYSFILKQLLRSPIPYLLDKKIIVAGSIAVLDDADKTLSSAYAEIIPITTIAIEPTNKTLINSLLEQKYDYLIFTSANAVNSFYTQAESSLLKNLKRTKIISIGTKTSKTIEHYGHKIFLQADKFSAEGIIQLLQDYPVAGKKFLLPISDLSRDELSEGLNYLKANVTKIVIYKNSVPSHLGHFNISEIEVIIFTSPSSYSNFCKLYDITNNIKYFSRTKIAAIGKTTKQAIEDTGLKVDFLPDEFSLEGVANKIKGYYEGKEH